MAMEERAHGKLGPRPYDATLRDIRAASERSDLPDAADDAPRPLPEGEPSRPPRRSPGHESPESPK